MIYSFFELLGVTPGVFLNWMVAIAITLFILDIFFCTELLSWLALFTFAIYFTAFFESKISIPVQWNVLLFILFLALSLVFYYAVWRALIHPLIARLLFNRKESQESIMKVSGQIGKFRLINGNPFVEWNGEIWGVHPDENTAAFQDAERVKILKEEDGLFTITKLTQ